MAKNMAMFASISGALASNNDRPKSEKVKITSTEGAVDRHIKILEDNDVDFTTNYNSTMGKWEASVKSYQGEWVDIDLEDQGTENQVRVFFHKGGRGYGRGYRTRPDAKNAVRYEWRNMDLPTFIDRWVKGNRVEGRDYDVVDVEKNKEYCIKTFEKKNIFYYFLKDCFVVPLGEEKMQVLDECYWEKHGYVRPEMLIVKWTNEEGVAEDKVVSYTFGSLGLEDGEDKWQPFQHRKTYSGKLLTMIKKFVNQSDEFVELIQKGPVVVNEVWKHQVLMNQLEIKIEKAQKRVANETRKLERTYNKNVKEADYRIGVDSRKVERAFKKEVKAWEKENKDLLKLEELPEGWDEELLKMQANAQEQVDQLNNDYQDKLKKFEEEFLTAAQHVKEQGELDVMTLQKEFSTQQQAHQEALLKYTNQE